MNLEGQEVIPDTAERVWCLPPIVRQHRQRNPLTRS
jgi:hypothetical protein